MKIDPRTTLDRARERRNGVRSAGQIERRIDRLERSDPEISGMVEGIDAITNLQYARFSTTPGVPSAGWVTGNLYWDSSWGVLSAQMTNDVTAHLSMNMFMPPTKNNSGVQIDRGDFVMATGVLGDRITIAKAVTDGSVAPDYMLGVAAHDIPNGATDGKIMAHGEVWQIDTSLWPIGTILYSDPATPGGLTSTKPTAPDIRTAIAFVLRQHVNTGRIMVRMTTGSVLGGSDQNVNFGTLADGDVVTWDATAGYWTNAPAGGGGGIGTLTPNGIVVQNASTPTYVSRSIAAGSNISVSNGDGVSGDPTVAVSATPTFTSVDTNSGNVTVTSNGSSVPIFKGVGSASIGSGNITGMELYDGATLGGSVMLSSAGRLLIDSNATRVDIGYNASEVFIGGSSIVTYARNRFDVLGDLRVNSYIAPYLGDSMATSDSVNLTTTQTTIMQTGNFLISANDTIRACIWGRFGVTTTATPTLTIRLRQSVTVASVILPTVASQALASNTFFVELMANASATTAAAGFARATAINNASATNDVNIHRQTVTPSTTISSSSTAWEVTLQWSGTTGQATIYGGYIEVFT